MKRQVAGLIGLIIGFLIIDQLIKFGSVEVSDNEGGESRFRSKPYYSYKEAQDYATFLKQQSIEGVNIIGEKSGVEIPLEEVQKIMNE